MYRFRKRITVPALVLALWPWLWLESGHAAVVMTIGRNFTGSSFSVNSSAIPPDSNGVIGPRHFVEFINGQFSVYSKATGGRVQSMTGIAFWSRAGVSLPAGWDAFGSRVVYDTNVGRWFVAQADSDYTAVSSNTNRLLLAISASVDPRGPWKAVAIDADPGQNNFADFPTLGLDSAGVYLSADMFDVNGSPLGATAPAG